MVSLAPKLAFTLSVALTGTAAAATQPFIVADVTNIVDVAEPAISPDGRWVTYTLTTTDEKKDERAADLWMTSWDGRQTLQLTQTSDSESAPGWSPDGKYISFLTARGDEDAPTQLWLLSRQGGEAQRLTDFKGDVLDYDWSPDGKRLALIVADEDLKRVTKNDEDKTRPPIVIDRYYFKEDETGYLTDLRRHLYVFDVSSKRAELLTPGAFDEVQPSWSPDGREIAFVSKRKGDPDRHSEFGLYAIAPTANATPRLITTFQGEVGDSSWSGNPAWSPNGRELAFVAANDPTLIYYSTHHLAIVPASGGTVRVVTAQLDRSVYAPLWSEDGRAVYVTIEDDGNQHLLRVNTTTQKYERIFDGARETTEFDLGPKGRIAVVDSTVDRPAEVFALENRKVRALSHANDALLAQRTLATTEEITFNSKDGTRVKGFVVKPPGFVAERRYPALLWIHGGPVSQYANSFTPTWQAFAAQGYVVVAANPRGSSGRGEPFASAIYADWGPKAAADVLAGVEHVVARGIADPNRLGVGGWSYGGILTNYVIATDARFKAAVSGASTGNALTGYGTDMYVREYEIELGLPWKDPSAYFKNSYPFFHADRIKTPTLFLCGERDFNVPLLNSEQMYQALRSVNVDAQLIIYPEQYHGITKPTYMRDRVQRYLDWFGKYLR